MKAEMPFLRTVYNYDREKASNESGLKCEDESRTQQQFAEESDINTIVRRFNLTGQLPDNIRTPTYDDFNGVTDFHTALNAVAEARESFDKLTAEVRAKFQNDPGQFVDFASDPTNLPELIKMGLAPPKTPTDTIPREMESVRPVTTSKELVKPAPEAGRGTKSDN